MSHNLSVRPRRNETQDRMIKRFIKKVKKTGIIQEIKEKRHYVKPSDKRRRARQKAIARRKKQQAKEQKSN